MSLIAEFALPGRAMIPIARPEHRQAGFALRKTSDVAKTQSKSAGGPRDRLMAAAYDLFAEQGVSQVGIDSILARSGCAKASLYGHFKSKDDLAIAFLDRREALWTRAWLEAEVKARSTDPEKRLLAIFDVFDGWFRKRSFEGCSFVNVLLESRPGSAVHRSASLHLRKIRSIVLALAQQAGLAEPEKFAQAWHMLMKGSIVSACEGNRNAAREAKQAAKLVLSGWQRARRPSRQR
ncbi:MAG: TetR/AcrR family transcriptional regulator [Pseudorhodoplanes sp.]|uniref:TetR/AcrR family transcriptional regulator n=1 Tax=Pseudorhodoplanes sp. TaxID=1934341 RepID=UPI003D11328C